MQLLTDLEAKIQSDAVAEDKAYAAYADWCHNGAKDKGFEIKTTKTEISGLTATIEKAQSDITEHTSKVEDLGGAITANNNDLAAAKEIRKKENSEYVVVEKELTDAIDTLERAINVLEKKMRGSNLLQAKVDRRDMKQVLRTLSTIIDAAAFTLQDKSKLLGLVQSRSSEDEEVDDVGAPAAEAYKSHSGSIIDTLEDLKQKAVEELESARKAEVSAQHNFEMLQQSLEDQIKVGTKEMGESKVTIHEATEVKATSEGQLANAKAELADAEKVLANMESDCAARAEDHDATVKNRAAELDALAQAKEAIQDIGNDGTRLVYGAGSGLNFLEIDSVGSKLETQTDLVNFEVVNLVRRLAREQNSPALAQLAGQLSSAMRAGAVNGADPFAKVKKLISTMIERLQKEAGDDASHKEYCDKEFAETAQKTGELKHDIDNYAAKLDKAKSESATLKEEVANLQSELAEIAKSQANADAVRKEESAVYVKSKADLEQGLNAVRMALKILRDYYGSSSSLMQQPAAPETHEASAGAGTGVIGMLEVVASDFGKSLATTEMNEEAAATAYQKLSMENKLSKTMKEQDVKYKTKAAAGLDKAASELSSDLDSAQNELDAVLEYTKNIRAMCEVKPESYEERKGRRDAELAGLKEALEILRGSSAFLQEKRRLRRVSQH
jgi:chromosome segregation ATPase